MPFDFGELVSPAHAVITCEMQRGVLGDLATDARAGRGGRRTGTSPARRRPVRGARAAGVRVVHATVELRADRAGLSINNPMMALRGEEPEPGPAGLALRRAVPGAGPEPEDIEIRRIHGLTPFTGTELDSVLRNLGVRTVVPVGVSVNEALLGLCLSAADLGYRIALPTDAIAGIPRSYAEDVVRNTLAFLSNLTTTAKVLAAWAGS